MVPQFKNRKPVFVGTYLILLSLLNLSIFLQFSSDTQYNHIRILCFTSEDLALAYLDLSLIVYENDTMLLLGSTRFETEGIQPSLKLEIEYSGNSTATNFNSAELIADVAFFYQNGSTHYFFGTYYMSTYIDPSLDDQRSKYSMNLTNEVSRARDLIYPEGPIEDCGIIGRMNFEATIGDSVGRMERKRYLRISLHTVANLGTILSDITIPERADPIDAKINDSEMHKVLPNRFDTTGVVTSMEQTDSEIYLEWEMPSEVPLLMKYPYNFIVPIILSLIVGWIGRYAYERVKSWRAPHSHLRVLHGDSKLTIDNIGEAPVEWADVTIRVSHNESRIRGFRIVGSLNIRKPEPYAGGDHFWVVINDITPKKDWGAIEIDIEGLQGIQVEVKSSCQHELGGKQTVGPAPTHSEWGEEESYEEWLQKHQG